MDETEYIDALREELKERDSLIRGLTELVDELTKRLEDLHSSKHK